jgi:hypothetical protein
MSTISSPAHSSVQISKNSLIDALESTLDLRTGYFNALVKNDRVSDFAEWSLGIDAVNFDLEQHILVLGFSQAACEKIKSDFIAWEKRKDTHVNCSFGTAMQPHSFDWRQFCLQLLNLRRILRRVQLEGSTTKFSRCWLTL